MAMLGRSWGGTFGVSFKSVCFCVVLLVFRLVFLCIWCSCFVYELELEEGSLSEKRVFTRHYAVGVHLTLFL